MRGALSKNSNFESNKEKKGWNVTGWNVVLGEMLQGEKLRVKCYIGWNVTGRNVTGWNVLGWNVFPPTLGPFWTGIIKICINIHNRYPFIHKKLKYAQNSDFPISNRCLLWNGMTIVNPGKCQLWNHLKPKLLLVIFNYLHSKIKFVINGIIIH